jgi:15-cis-phytoene synthase
MKKALVSARDTIKRYGSGYYRATILFPQEIKEAVWVLYEFVRLPDEIVDGEGLDKAAALEAWEKGWCAVAEEGVVSDNQTMMAFLGVVKKYQIPLSYTYDFFAAMRQDLTKKRYQTYEELEGYMHGSASVVGYMMSHIIGYRGDAFPYARALAEAFQMTNFIRDIKEDYDLRGRIYLPATDCQRFGVTEEHIAAGVRDEAWRKLITFEIARTRAMYEKGVSGIPLLDVKGQRAVYAAALIYKDILDKIEYANCDVFSERIYVGSLRKTMLLCKALVWNKNQL